MAVTRKVTDSELNSVNKRILKIKIDLCDGSNIKFASMLNLSRQAASNICKEGYSVGKRTFERILKAFPQVSSNWLMVGVGDMLVDDGTQEAVKPDSVTQDNPFEIQAVPCIPSGIYKRQNYDCVEFIANNNVPRIPLSNSFGTIDMLYTVRDESMTPFFHAGDIIGVREVEKGSTIVNGNVYLINSSSCGMLLRMVYDIGGDTLELQPMEGSRYRGFTIPKSDVLRIFSAIYLVRPYL